MAQFEIKDGEPSFPREQPRLGGELFKIAPRLRASQYPSR